MHERIADNVAKIRHSITEAAARSSRSPDEVTLVAVTKYVGSELIRPLYAAGCRQLGESRPQQFWGKAEELKELEIEWHLIGHLQRNKARRTLPYVSLVHSGDSLRLLETLNELSRELKRVTDVLVEVNISGDESKHGFSPDDVERTLPKLAELASLRIRGLMGMAAWGTSPEEARRDFAALRQLRDRLRPNCPPEIQLDDLSMGMSGDFEVAIEEGATLVRVGSALFEGVSP